MTNDTEDDPQTPVLHAEDLEHAVNALLALARSEGESIRRADKGRRVFTTVPEKPDITERLADQLRSALEDEIIPAAEAAPGSVINERELDREVIKKALIGLKYQALKQLIREHRLDATGNIEHLAYRLAAAYHWDEAAVARLVLENEPEPVASRGHVTRLFALDEPPDLSHIKSRLEYVVGRYIRIGVARWFIFQDVEIFEDTLRLRGIYRAYQARVEEGTDDEPSLAALPAEHGAMVEMHEGLDVLQIQSGHAQSGKGAVTALKAAAALKPLGYVPFRTPTEESGMAISLAAESRFMLDLLYTRLRELGLRQLNLTVLRFKVGEGSAVDEDNWRRPSLRAIRFEGTHVLDSVAACTLLAQGRELLDVGLQVQWKASDGTVARFPVRLSLERDHVSGMTGFGTAYPEGSISVHHRVVSALRDEVSQGIRNFVRLESLVTKIFDRATASSEAEVADMFAEDEGEEGQ